ncbi:aldo/keto reductase [Nostoc sp. C117]|uniref:aldo/keto reductase n=1 Tax=Nostoc sp. C117 TaxID=3349875 RepID=UPI00370D5321
MKLGIGTAQFGLDYGLSNNFGKTPSTEVSKILNLATLNGIHAIDTAYIYGKSEDVLGEILSEQHNFDIITKTPQFSKATLSRDDSEFLENTFYNSLSRLRQSGIYALLVHNPNDLLVKNSHFLMEKMLFLKSQGLIKKIGVSVYTSEQIDCILSKYSIDIIQVPINVLDQRLLLSGHLSKLKTLGIEIHARSIFLQGLLLMSREDIPSYFDSIKGHLNEYHNFIKNQGFSSLEAALSFMFSIDEIDICICGVNNYQHLDEILAAMNKVELKFGKALARFSISDKSILNPSDWRI